MKRAKANSHRRAARSTPRQHRSSPAQRPVLVLGLCRPGLFILIVAYLLLATSAALLYFDSMSKLGKLLALVAYLTVASLLVWKAYKYRGSLGSKGREPAGMAGRDDTPPVTGASPLPPSGTSLHAGAGPNAAVGPAGTGGHQEETTA